MENLELTECAEMLKNNYICHLAFISQQWPFVIPITYYYDQTDNCIISYSGEGHKIDAMRSNNLVSIQVEEIEYINKWKSILILGKFEEITGLDAKCFLKQFVTSVKLNILKKEKKDLHFINEFSSKIDSGSRPIVYRIKILEITGMQRTN